MTNPNNPFDAIATDASRVNDGRPGKAPVPKKPARTLSSFADLDEAGIGVGYGYQPQEADALGNHRHPQRLPQSPLSRRTFTRS